MKKNGGFISILILMVMALSIIMISYIFDLNKLQTLILSSTRDNIQSFYNGEDKIFKCLYDEYYVENQLNPILFDVFSKANFATKQNIIKIDSKDLEDGDFEDIIRMEFKDIKDKKHLILKAKSNVNGTVTNVISEVNLVNEIFETNISILDIKLLEKDMGKDYIDKFQELTSQIENSINIKSLGNNSYIYGFETNNYQQINLTENKLICTRDSMKNDYVESLNKTEVFIICKKYKDNYIDLYINQVNNKNSLSGIMYIEGNLNISTDFQFNGIIIINGGDLIIDEDKKLGVEGIIIYINNEEERETPNNLNIEYKRRILYKYGIYLPEFFDIKHNLIKSN